jgi:hypothetical protein
MLDGEAAMLMEELKRALTLVAALTKRVDSIEMAMRTLHQASQRQHQAIRAGRSHAAD